MDARRSNLLLPSLVSEAARDLDWAVQRTLLHSPLPEDAASYVVFVAVEDGAPERRNYLLATGVDDAPAQIEGKDAFFYQFCRVWLELYDAVFFEYSSLRRGQDKRDHEDRLWQDACVAAFIETSDGVPLQAALKAAFHLHRELWEHNECSNADWTERVHARVCIGLTVRSALACLPSSWRGETALDGELTSSLDVDLCKVLLSAGLRGRCTDAEWNAFLKRARA